MPTAYLLDTNVVSNIQDNRRNHDALRQRVRAEWDRVFISPVTVSESLQGATALVRRYDRPDADPRAAYKLLIDLVNAVGAFKVADYDAAATDRFRKIPANVRTRIGVHDSRIAATALARGLTLVTSNVKHFQQVPGLRVEDWALLDPDAVPPPPYYDE